MLTHFKERRRRKRMASVRQRQMRRLRALAQWWPLESRWRWADCVNLTWEQLIHTSPTAHSHETPASFAQNLSKINHRQNYNDLLSFGPLHSNEMDEVCSVQLVEGGVGGGGGGGGGGGEGGGKGVKGPCYTAAKRPASQNSSCCQCVPFQTTTSWSGWWWLWNDDNIIMVSTVETTVCNIVISYLPNA